MLRRSLLVAALLVPLVGPMFAAISSVLTRDSWRSLHEVDRLASLASQSLQLSGLTALLALPAGTILALLLFRSDLAAGRLWLVLLALTAFVPLPVFALAWQAVLGGWQPWAQGVVPAAGVHALAALPWVVWLVGLALLRGDRDQEDEARIHGSPAVVFRTVILRQASPGIVLALAWILLQTLGEFTVTDLMVVRTFAEEVYTQYTLGGPGSLGRAVAVSLPGTLLAIACVSILMRRFEGWRFQNAALRPTRIWRLGIWRIPGSMAIGLLLLIYLGVPVAALLRQAAGDDAATWSRLSLELRRAFRLNGILILDSLACSLLAGIIATALATALALWAVESRARSRLLLTLAVVLWSMPGPVLGFGLKECIELLMKLEDLVLAGTSSRPLRTLLYDEPNPFPVLWAHVLRTFPYAFAILWPSVREIPRDLRELARMEGASPWREFREVGWPATRRPAGIAIAACTALATGELAASKLVQIPGRMTFVQELFGQMHYGPTATTASLTLLQLAASVLPVLLLAWRWTRQGIS